MGMFEAKGMDNNHTLLTVLMEEGAQGCSRQRVWTITIPFWLLYTNIKGLDSIETLG